MLARCWALLCRIMLLAACAFYAGAACLAVLRYPLPVLLLAGVLAMRRLRPKRGQGWAHGTARIASAGDLYRSGLIGRDHGLILGRAGFAAPQRRPRALRTLLTAPLGQSAMACRLFLSAFQSGRWSQNSLIRISDYVHLCTFAPTGRGKGVACLIPNLLDHPGACVVTDPQASLTRNTARFRERVFGHRIVVLDPFRISGRRQADSFNPLDLIGRDSPYLLDQCRELANAMVVRTGKEHEPHFNDMAEAVLTLFIAFVCVHEMNPAHRNLQTVREIVSNRNRFVKGLERMQELDACGGMLRRMAAQLASWLVDRELGSVMSSVQRHTTWMDSPAMAACLERSSFNPLELKATGRMTIYLCLPPDKLASHAPLMRLWVGGLLRAVAAGGIDERRTVLFLLDEAGHLGHIQALEDAVTLGRAYGVRLWFFFQSVGQLAKCFGEHAGTFLDNIDTQQFFGLNAIDSAEAVSRRMGTATIETESRQEGESYVHPTWGIAGNGQPGQRTTSSNVTVSEMGRQLLRPEEVIGLPEDVAVIFHRNLPPILGRLVKFFNAPELFRGGAGSSQRLGLGGALMSALFLAGSLAAVAGAACLPLPIALPPPAHGPAQPAGMQPGVFYPARPYPELESPAWSFDEGINGQCPFCGAPMRLGRLRNENVRCRRCGEIMGVSRARLRP